MSRIDAKVVLLGKSYAGKTCLVNRYTRETFDSNIPYQNVSESEWFTGERTIDSKLSRKCVLSSSQDCLT